MNELAAGGRYFIRGQRWVASHGRLYAFCLLPALIAFLLYLGALALLSFYVGDLAAWATPFADDWSSGLQAVVRVGFAVLVMAAGLLLAVLTFTAVTLLIGDPFYESLSEKVEESEGGLPEGPDLPWWRELWTSLTDSLYVLMRATLLGLPLFVLGFLPLVGQTVVPVLGIMVSGFFLTLELTSLAMQRRGIDVRARLRMLRARKGLALGFGVPVVVCFLVPGVAIFLMPGAVAGATLLVRDLTGTPPSGEQRAEGLSMTKEPRREER